MTQTVKNLPVMQETQVQPLGQEDLLQKEWLPTPVFLPGESQGRGPPQPLDSGIKIQHAYVISAWEKSQSVHQIFEDFLKSAFLIGDLHGGSDGKESACKAGDLCSIPGWKIP